MPPQALRSAQDLDDLETIKGWFHHSDRYLFAWLLQHQIDHGAHGNLVELGSYLGKSAVFIGDFLQSGETFTVLDLFESEAADDDNQNERRGSYATLTEQAFRQNYLRFHPELPVVVKATSDHIVEHVEPGSVRFMHIDASHLYEHVAGDADAAKSLLQEDGVVVFDDFRSEHCPGVAAAAWEAVTNKGLNLLAVTESKLYGTWGDPAPLLESMAAWLQDNPDAWFEWQRIHGQRMIRAKITAPKPAVAPAPPTPPTPKPVPVPAAPPTAEPTRSGRSTPRRIAKDWLPPAIHRAVSKRITR